MCVGVDTCKMQYTTAVVFVLGWFGVLSFDLAYITARDVGIKAGCVLTRREGGQGFGTSCPHGVNAPSSQNHHQNIVPRCLLLW